MNCLIPAVILPLLHVTMQIVCVFRLHVWQQEEEEEEEEEEEDLPSAHCSSSISIDASCCEVLLYELLSSGLTASRSRASRSSIHSEKMTVHVITNLMRD